MIDPGRLRRALALEWEPLPIGGWLVGDRVVDPDAGCSCPDAMYRGPGCKHELATRLSVLDPEVRAALVGLTTES